MSPCTHGWILFFDHCIDFDLELVNGHGTVDAHCTQGEKERTNFITFYLV